MLPSFLGIGAQRAGTTWLHQVLAEHPQVGMPRVKKEVHYFDAHYQRGRSWYEAKFEPTDGKMLVGEVCPNYLDADRAIERIATDLPEAKLLVVLREPVDRARSAAELFGDRYNRSLVRACRESRELVRCGLYAMHLKRVFAHFPRRQVKVWLYEDMKADPARLVREAYAFIGVDAAFTPPSLNRRYNRVMYPKAQQALSRWKLAWTIDAIKRTPLADLIRRRHAARLSVRTAAPRQPDGEDLSPVRALFREDVLELEQLIGRDLSDWLEPSSARARAA